MNVQNCSCGWTLPAAVIFDNGGQERVASLVCSPARAELPPVDSVARTITLACPTCGAGYAWDVTGLKPGPDVQDAGGRTIGRFVTYGNLVLPVSRATLTCTCPKQGTRQIGVDGACPVHGVDGADR